MALTPNEAYAAKQPFVDKETLEHIVEQFPTPCHLFDEAGIRRTHWRALTIAARDLIFAAAVIIYIAAIIAL